MGWFSETKTYVGASVFNLAGEMDAPPNLMGSAVASFVMSGGSSDLSGAIQKSLLGSTAMNQRRFFTWAQKSYGLGMPTGSLGAALQVSSDKIHSAVRSALALEASQILQILFSEVDAADVTHWAEDWVRRNRPDLEKEDWSAELDINAGRVRIEISEVERASFQIPADLLWGLSAPGRLLLFVTYRIVTQNGTTGHTSQGQTKLFTYRMGSGTKAFDDHAKAKRGMDEFYPVLPLRRDNKSIRHTDFAADFPTVEEGFRKLFGRNTKIDELLDDLEENEDIGEVDFCYLVPGVLLDTKDQAVMAYLYEFFRMLEADQETGNVTEFLEQQQQVGSHDVAWNRWLRVHDASSPIATSSIYKMPKPDTSYEAESAPTLNQVLIEMAGLPEFSIALRWFTIKESHHVGNARYYDGDRTRSPLAKGRYWIHAHETRSPARNLGKTYLKTQDWVEIFHQYDARRYRKIRIQGLQHVNHIYKGRYVTTHGKDAVLESGESSFLIPLHSPTLRNLGLVKANQLSTSSSYLLFQHYQKVKLKWYQTKAFRWAVAIAGVALAVVTAGGSLGAAAGILGTNAAVGAALGATAATAAIVGAAVNAIAGMIVASLLTKASVALFGEKWGHIVGTIASFVALQYGAQYASHGNFAVDWGKMMRAENIMKITSSVSNAYNQWQAIDTAQIYERIQELGQEHAEKLEEIQDLSQDILGMTGTPFDPMLLTDAAEQFGERPETFLSRTLLTGSDIAQISLSMIEDFADASLELPQALR